MRLAALFRDMPIRRKLTLIAVLSAGAALFFAALISMAHQWFLFRAELVKATTSQATIVAANSTSALLFNDPKSAKQTLDALGAFGNIEFAMLHDKQGKLFALFVPVGLKHPQPHPPPQEELHNFTATHLDVFHPIILEGERVGTIHVRSSLAQVYQQMAWSGLIVAAAALGGLGLALVLIGRMHPAITDPMGRLVGVMDRISKEKNYSLRVELYGRDEVGILARAFNDMLDRIQERDARLEQHREHLEDEIAQRTAALREANELLGKELLERKQAELALHDSEEKFRAISAAAQNAVIMLDNEGNISYWNPAAETIFGHTREEALGQDLHTLLAPERFREAYRKGFDRFRTSGEGAVIGKTIELAALRKGGEEFSVEISLSAVRLGNQWNAIGIIRDVTERKRAEEKIRESEARYRGIFEYADDIIYLLAPNGTFNSLSPSFERLTGWHPDEWVGKPFASIIHPDDLPHALEVFQKALSGQSTQLFELRIAKEKGEYFDSELSIVPVNPGGEIAAIGIARDVTARKQAQEEIRKQQELTARIIETIPMRVFWKDRDLRYLGCNTLFAKDAGLTRPDELIGKTDFDMGWKDQAEIYRADDRLVMDSNAPKLSYDEPQTTPEGGQIWLRSSKVPLVNESNESIGVLGVYEDITERTLAAQALEESERKFRTILDSAVDGILVADAQTHKFVTANRAICDMLGYPPEEIYRLGLEDIHPAEALPHVQTQFERQMKGEIRVASGLPVKRRGGSVFFADVSSSPMVLAGRLYLVGVFHDVTARKKAEEKIRRLNEELEEKVRERTQQLLEAQEDLLRKEKLAVLGQVAGSVGHELRNPLGVMNNAVYFLQTVLSDADDTVKEYLGMIKTEIVSADRIVSDLLDSVRIKPPHPEEVGVGELIGQVLRKLIVPATVAVHLDIPVTLPLLRVDPLQVQQVLRNLISNGIDAMPEGGALEIRAMEAADGKAVAVSVRDTGCGIPPKQMARLFQPLFTTKKRGIGLGLVVVKNLTQANGGKVDVQSEPGKGTTFTITLPNAASTAQTDDRITK